MKLKVGSTLLALATVSLASDTIVATLPASGVTTPTAASVEVARGTNSSATAPLTITSGHVYYIAANGSDGAGGSISAPWLTIDGAANKMKPGDLAYLRAGTYPNSFAPTASGTAAAPLTFMGYPGEKALLTSTLAIKGSYLTFDYLHVTNAVEYDIGIDVEVTATGIVVSNTEVYGTKGQGIIVTGSHNTFLRNQVHDNGMHSNQDHGIYVSGGYNTFRYNTVYNNWCYGMQLYSGSADVVGGNDLVEMNYIYHNGYGAKSTGSNYTAGIILSLRHPNETVRNNVICDNADFAILAELEAGRSITGNVSCYNGSGGYLIAASATATTMSGNISYMDANWALQAFPGTTSDNEIYWSGSAAPDLEWNSSDYSLAKFQSASGQDAHSKVADPKFSSVPSTGFLPASAAGYNFCTTANATLCTPF